MNTYQRTFLLLGFIATSSYADMFAFENVGNTIIPRSETDISMDAETVRIIPIIEDHNRGYIVCCDFILTNLSEKPVTNDMAFPIEKIDFCPRMSRGFVVTIVQDGKTNTVDTALQLTGDNAKASNLNSVTETNTTGALNYAGYIVWQQSFQAGETQIVRCKYPMGEPAFIPLWKPFSGREFKYIVRTGALWKGSIKDAKIVLCLKDPLPQTVQVSMSYPNMAKWESPKRDKLIWNFTNWEPTEDIVLSCTEWTGYNTNDITANHYRLPTPYTGSKKQYRQSYLDRLTELEVQRVAKYYPDRKLDRNFLRSMIAECLFYELFAQHNDGFILGSYSEENLAKFEYDYPSHNDEFIYSRWRGYFKNYSGRGGWYQPYDHRKKEYKHNVSYDDLTPAEQQNAVFLKKYTRSELIRSVPE